MRNQGNHYKRIDFNQYVAKKKMNRRRVYDVLTYLFINDLEVFNKTQQHYFNKDVNKYDY